MNDSERILSFLKIQGPVLPVQVAKHIHSNILLASAHLSELVSQGKVKISQLKIGGSPLYYLPEQKNKLQNFSHHLNPKDQQTLKLLKEKKILRERALDLLTRVSLRNIKDFASPLKVTFNNQTELFWKWFLLSDQEALALIKDQLTSFKKEEDPSSEEKLSSNKESLQDYPEKELKREIKKEEERKEEGVKEIKEIKDAEEETKPKKKPFFQKVKETLKKKKTISDTFSPQIKSFFQEKEIEIKSQEILRKNSEINFILKVPSVIGSLTYFCKAKNKKRCDEKDLSAAYMEAQAKKLPLLFLYTQELSKKAQEILNSGTFKNITVKKLKINKS